MSDELQKTPAMAEGPGISAHPAQRVIDAIRRHRYSWERAQLLRTNTDFAGQYADLQVASDGDSKRKFVLDPSGWVACTKNSAQGSIQYNGLSTPSCLLTPGPEPSPFYNSWRTVFPPCDAFGFDPVANVTIFVGKDPGHEVGQVFLPY